VSSYHYISHSVPEQPSRPHHPHTTICVLILYMCPHTTHTTIYYTAYQTSPLGRTILGTEDNIKNMTRDLITNYIQVLLYMCPHTTMCPRTPIYVSLYYMKNMTRDLTSNYIQVLLYMCPHTTMCPHTLICVLMLPYLSPYATIFVPLLDQEYDARPYDQRHPFIHTRVP
jgi:hypothetical protein